MSTARAKERLAALTDAEDESQSLVLSLTRRISELHKSLGNSPHGANSEDYRSELIRLQDRLREHQAKHQAAAAICANVRGFLQRLPASADIIDAKVPKVAKLTKGKTFIDAVDDVRIEIGKLLTERTSVQRAGLPLDECKAQAAQWVDANAAAPRIISGHGGFSVSFASESMARGNPSVTEILCWLVPDLIKEKLFDECEANMPQRGIVLSPSEKSKRLATIAENLNEHERMEVELILAAANEGQHIQHRHDVSPGALLGIQIGAKAKASA